MLSNYIFSRILFRAVMSTTNSGTNKKAKKKRCSISLTPIWFVGGLCFIYVICICLPVLVSRTISISDDVRVVYQLHDGCNM